jgi:ABC-2 type transport system permease protein
VSEPIIEPTSVDLGPSRSVLLVGRHEFEARLRSRPALVGSALVLVLLVAFLLLQATVFGHTEPVRVGLAGQAISLQDVLPQDVSPLGVAVTVSQVDSVDDGVAQVRSGQLDVLVSGARSALRVTVDNQLDPRLRTTLDSLVRQQVLDAQIAQLGMRPQDVLSRVDQAGIALTRLKVTDPDQTQRLSVGVVAALLVALALALYASLAALGVTADARRGTAEVLLTVVLPRRLLRGNLSGLGVAAVVHLAVVGVLAAAFALLTGVVSVPGSVFGALGAGLLWFVLGFALYGTAAATGAARWPRRVDQRRLLAALVAGLAVVFAISAALLAADPTGSATAVLSVLPPFAPVLMPGRMAAGVAPVWQVVLALGLALACAAALAWHGARVYTKSLSVAQTGS